MSYEVQFQSGGTDYTVRAETIEDTLALIQRLQALTKPADDGWVEWNGGNRPVAAGCEVEIVCRDGSTRDACARIFDWLHRGEEGDIVRYRVCALF